jgi:pimeloyl-ACP methyl ester carboxylesterase
MITAFTLWILSVTACQAYSPQLGQPEDIAFTSQLDGSEQRYVLMLPSDFSKAQPHALMIALHGHGSDRWQFARDPRDECRAAREIAAENNMIYACPDYRAKTSWMGPAATSDLLQILDELKDKYLISKVLICGGSMGGSSALAFATLHPERVDGVVSLNGTANMLEYAGFEDAIKQAYGGSKMEVPEVYRARSAELNTGRLKFPVATTTGGRDELVPPQSTLRMIKQLETQGTLCLSIHHPDGGHSTDLKDAREALLFVLKHW